MKNLLNLKLVTPLAFAALLSACSSVPDYGDIVDAEIERTEAQMEAKERRQAREMELRKENLESLPDWALNPPRPDETGIYGVSIEVDKNIQTAIRKGNLQARYDVAKEIRFEMAGEDTMTGSGAGQYRYVINGFVDSVDLAGVETVRREIVPAPEGYQVLTLVKLPLGEFNAVLNAYKQDLSNAEPLQHGYERLMARIKERQEQQLNKVGTAQ